MIIVPLLAAVLLAVACASGTRAAMRVSPLAGLGALALAVWPTGPLELPELLVGLRFRIDDASRALLLLVGVAWPLAAWFARTAVGDSARFWTWWNATLAGLLLAMTAADIAGFYAGYATTTLAAYGLIAHDGSAESRRAARIYLTLAFVAEMAVLYGLLTLASGEELPTHARWLLFAGFALKLGIVPLHVWLPLAHAIAPAPASAVLSGIIVKLGLLGWLRFLPRDLAVADAPVIVLIAAGVFTAFYGALMGLGQRKLKTVLAYSTVSQSGLVCTGFALVLAGQPIGPLLAFALHHGLNKAALFVAAGIGVGRSRARLALMALPAAALAGVPFSSGFLAKGGIKHMVHDAGIAGWTLLALTLTAVTTTLLMMRALWLARRIEAVRPMHAAWPFLVAAGILVPWGWALAEHRSIGILDAVWPIAVALVFAAAWLRAGRRGPTIPEGDLLAFAERLPRLEPGPPAAEDAAPPTLIARFGDRILAAVERNERRLIRVPATGLVMLLLTVVLWLLM